MIYRADRDFDVPNLDLLTFLFGMVDQPTSSLVLAIGWLRAGMRWTI